MTGEKNLEALLRSMKPVLNEGSYVFCTLKTSELIPNDVICFFKEKEGTTIILKKEIADKLHFDYTFTASWITLTIHSSLNAVGFTAAISTALTKNNISCNVVAAYYHDHLFIEQNDAEKAMQILNELSRLL